MFRSLAPAALVLVSAATTTQAEEGAFDISVGGRVHVEASTSSPDPALEERFEFEDGVDWRRARVVLNGEFLDRFTFKIEHDFASGDIVPTDVFIEATPT
ncbi:MAG: hypothetical protein OXG81_13535, partial [Acidobacteria bacterium]|nr:hypothetical protein [Acidobacteriota bacterium]